MPPDHSQRITTTTTATATMPLCLSPATARLCLPAPIIRAEPTTATDTLSGAHRSRLSARCNVGERAYLSAWRAAHSGRAWSAIRRQWIIETERLTETELARAIVSACPHVRDALTDLHNAALRASSEARADDCDAPDLSGIVDTESVSAMPEWLGTGNVGRVKVGRVAHRRNLPTYVRSAIERCAIVPRMVEWLRKGSVVFVATAEPGAFLRLGHNGCDSGVCFGSGGCHALAPIALAESRDSVVFYVKRADDRGAVLCRAWGTIDDDGIGYTNTYARNIPGEGSILDTCAYLAMTMHLCNDNPRTGAWSFDDMTDGQVYDNGDGRYVGRAPSLYCESDLCPCQRCEDCGDRVNDDDAHYVDDTTLCEYCLSQNYTYVESADEYVNDNDVCTLYTGEPAIESDCIELHDGEYALSDDNDVCTLYNGEYALHGRDDIVNLYDGEYALADDANLCDNGEWSRADDTIETADGLTLPAHQYAMQSALMARRAAQALAVGLADHCTLYDRRFGRTSRVQWFAGEWFAVARAVGTSHNRPR